MKGWTEHALTQLEDAGYRKGGARRAVVEHLGTQACAVSALDVETALRGSGRTVGRASVYRVLEQLEALRLVSRLEVGDGITRYEPSHPSGEHHHHLVCDSCGAVTPFEDPELEKAVERVASRMPFAVAEHDIVLHGQCGACT
jgi:Fur family transcriptional regulator, ferric uptake regulator